MRRVLYTKVSEHELAPHQCLYKEDSLLPDVSDTVIDVDHTILFHSIQYGVQDNEGPCSPYTSTAVDQEGLGVTQRMSIADSTSEIDKGHSIRGYSVIRPGGVVELSHFKRRRGGKSGLYMSMSRSIYKEVLVR